MRLGIFRWFYNFGQAVRSSIGYLNNREKFLKLISGASCEKLK